MDESQVDGLKKMVTPHSIGLKVITVVSGKGGVGKSSMSTNLAILYGQRGRKVLIMDGDLGLANINVLMGLIPRFTILDVLKGTKTLTEVIVPYNSQVDLLPGATGFYQLADLDIEKQQRIIEGFMQLEGYDVIIIDAGAGISSVVINFVNISDEVVLVSTPEPTALTDAYGMLKVIASKSNKEEASLIVNMTYSEQQGMNVYQKLHSIAHRFLSFSLHYLGTVPDSQEMKRSILEQKPIVNLLPSSSVSQSLKSIIHKMENIPENKETKNTHSGVGDFLKKLFSRN